MPTDLSANLHNVLLRRLVSEITQRVVQARPTTRHASSDDMPPMLYRSEGFAEDLCDSHPCH